MTALVAQVLPTTEWRFAKRIYLRFDGQQTFDVERVDLVRMRATPSAGPPPLEKRHSGAWVELRDPAGTLLFFRRMHDPYGMTSELYELEQDKMIVRLLTRPPQPTLSTVVVPDIPGAVFSLKATPPRSWLDREGAVTVVEFELARLEGKEVKRP
jgi:hypothetical protein